MKISKGKVSNYSYFVVSNKDQVKVFEIKGDGTVWFIKNGKFQEAKTDTLLGHALGSAIITMAFINRDLINRAK